MPTKIKTPIGQRLRSLREAADVPPRQGPGPKPIGMSRAELAERAGISKSYLQAIEEGRRPATWELVCRLADALGVGVGELR
jgi:transcriptional regulator with XRE-family HTH domain